MQQSGGLNGAKLCTLNTVSCYAMSLSLRAHEDTEEVRVKMSYAFPLSPVSLRRPCMTGIHGAASLSGEWHGLVLTLLTAVWTRDV